MRVDQCVSAVRVVEVPAFVYLRSSCSHVTEVGGGVRFVRLELKVIMQSDGDFVDVILVHSCCLCISKTSTVTKAVNVLFSALNFF